MEKFMQIKVCASGGGNTMRLAEPVNLKKHPPHMLKQFAVKY